MALLLTALATSGLLVGSPALRRTPTINMGLHDLSANPSEHSGEIEVSAR